MSFASTRFAGPVDLKAGDDCQEWPTLWQTAIERDDPDVAVLLIGAWEVFDVEVDGRRLPFGAPEHEALLREELSRALEVLGAGRTEVVVLTTPCFHHYDDAEFRDGSERNDPVRVAWVNRLLADAVAARGSDARLVDLGAIVCPGGHFTSELGGVPLRLDDGVHFDVRGTPLVWEALLPDVLDAAQDSVGTTTVAGAVTAHGAEGVVRSTGSSGTEEPARCHLRGDLCKGPSWTVGAVGEGTERRGGDAVAGRAGPCLRARWR